ncbi:unnamed protein product [Rhizoctonia solani]|uniref:Tyrosinase copper-binding domain-containing protein n=1 Tax=Rhizoctonia solani TaxID=456999 RepID=A0A8H3D189_9AGAM|nr:unnamed protein product [Rhizoctonia solani]
MKLFTVLGFTALLALASGTKSAKECDSIEVRKEWRSFTKQERKAWIDANNCLNKLPSNGKLKLDVDTNSFDNPAWRVAPYDERGTYYDDLVYAHMNLNSLIHWTGRFLPWHRVYLFEWTNILREECGYEGVVPYWAWEKGKHTDDFEGSEMWDPHPEHGLGGYSDDPSDDYVVHDGALDIFVAYPVPHRLRRHYIPYPYDIPVPFNNSKIKATDTFTPEVVQELLDQPEGNFTLFQSYLEGLIGMHSSIHLMMGGDMGTLCPNGTEGTVYCPSQRTATFSTNDPVFHLHHGNIDRLWWLWQEKSDENKYAYHGGSVQNVSSLDVYQNGQPPWLSKSTELPNAVNIIERQHFMRTRKKSKWVTIVVPCPNCGCGCDVRLGGNDDAASVLSDSDSEHAAKRPRLSTPDPSSDFEPEPEPDPDPEPDPEPHFDSDPDPYANSDEELDPTQAPPSTHVERFFAKYPLFKYNPSQHIMAEFYRLCALGIHRERTLQRFRDALTQDFNEMYGVDEDDLGAWQRLCGALVTEIPDEIEACRKIVQSRFINIVDLVDTRITENPVLQFKSEAELSSYTKTTGKYFPHDNEHAGGLLKFLLRFIVFPKDVKEGKLELPELNTRQSRSLAPNADVDVTSIWKIRMKMKPYGDPLLFNAFYLPNVYAKISVSSGSEAEAPPVPKRPRIKLETSDSEFESKPVIAPSSQIQPPSSCPPTVISDSDSDDDIPPWPTTYPGPEPPSQLPKPEPASPTPPPRHIKPEPLTQTNIHQFFSQYRSFSYNPSQPIMSEFYRMVDSKDFPKASQAQAKREIEDALTMDFNLIYGTDVGDLKAWQGLCRVLQFEYIPDDLFICKKLVADTHVNIVDLIDTKISGKPVRHFESEKELAKYTIKHKKFFPRNNVHTGSLLKFLLRRIHEPRTATRDYLTPLPPTLGR